MIKLEKSIPLRTTSLTSRKEIGFQLVLLCGA